jgi:4-carboxymuconolactone decarboxylase
VSRPIISAIDGSYRETGSNRRPVRDYVCRFRRSLPIKFLVAVIASFSVIVASVARADDSIRTKTMSIYDLRSVSPALQNFTSRTLLGDLWKRPQLSPRDRSIVTIATLIARSQSIEMDHHFSLALDNGVKPSELSEIITHLAFYSGWASATLAASVANGVYAKRGIGEEQVADTAAAPIPIDPAAEAQRVAAVDQSVGPTFQGLVDYTSNVLFHDLWLRSALAPRDRSLVTVAALIAAGQVAQITFHLNKAMDNGLTQEQAAEVITQLAFYAGWPNAMSAVPVAKAVFEKRKG